MVTELKIDGVYRPEKWFDGQWHAVAYISFRGGVNRIAHSENFRGRTHVLGFGSEDEAQKICNRLNNVQSPDPIGEWKAKVRAEQAEQAKEREPYRSGYIDLR